jgi:hypothetical protein
MKITKKMPEHDVTETLSFSIAAFKAIEAHGWGNRNSVGLIRGSKDVMYMKVGQTLDMYFSCPSGYRRSATNGVGLKDENYKQINTTPQGYVNRDVHDVFEFIGTFIGGSTGGSRVRAIKPGYEIRSLSCYKNEYKNDKINRVERRVIVAVAP